MENHLFLSRWQFFLKDLRLYLFTIFQFCAFMSKLNKSCTSKTVLLYAQSSPVFAIRHLYHTHPVSSIIQRGLVPVGTVAGSFTGFMAYCIYPRLNNNNNTCLTMHGPRHLYG